MAKKWAKQFYNSKAWRDIRLFVLRRDCYNCSDCGGRAEEVHHKEELSEQNINDVNISLNPKNLISLCHDCHSKITKQAIDCSQDYSRNLLLP